MEKVKKFYLKYKSIFAYLFFGVCTTILNWAVYFLCYDTFTISNIISTIIAWIIAVAFAFVTNKLWVFNSKLFDKKTVFYEICSFTVARLATGVLDVIIMFLAVDIFSMNSNIWKLLSNIIVIILNYIFSKLYIFNKNNIK